MASESLAAQMRTKRSELMISELEGIALRLFEERGFAVVTVDEIAAEAPISVRTFYRYFPAKEDVLQVKIDKRTQALRVALSVRPADEPPLHSLRVALEEVVSAEDPAYVRRWTAVVAATPGVLNAVIGGIHLKSDRAIAEFLGSRLGVPSDNLVPTMLAAAVGGVIQAASTQWFLNGGNLAAKISEGLEVLEQGIGSDSLNWSGRAERPRSARRTKPTSRRSRP